MNSISSVGNSGLPWPTVKGQTPMHFAVMRCSDWPDILPLSLVLVLGTGRTGSINGLLLPLQPPFLLVPSQNGSTLMLTSVRTCMDGSRSELVPPGITHELSFSLIGYSSFVSCWVYPVVVHCKSVFLFTLFMTDFPRVSLSLNCSVSNRGLVTPGVAHLLSTRADGTPVISVWQWHDRLCRQCRRPHGRGPHGTCCLRDGRSSPGSLQQ